MAEDPPERRKGPPIARILICLVVMAALAILIGWRFWRLPSAEPRRFTGYVTADNLYLSSPVAGTVAALGVARGQRVAAGQPLFRIDPTSLDARADQARAQIDQSEAQVATQRADLAKARASLAQVEVETGRAEDDLARYLAADREKAGSVAGQQIELARAAVRSLERQRDAARTEVAAAAARIEAGRAGVKGSQAALADAAQQVSQLAPAAPVAARVDDVMFQKGEWAAANAAVVSLVPDDQVKLRFYVPEAVVASFQPGARVQVGCDGCAAGMTGIVDYVASRPEYTPPVIYSLATREKMVFLIEAVPSSPRALNPGQPIDVALAGAGGGAR